jgi:glutamate/tyrosine decarboxylase-like PLP-dependent enzyme
MTSKDEPTLDPANWEELRALGHRMLDDMVDYIRDIRERPVWQAMPYDARAAFASPLPQTPSDPAAVYADFERKVVPYALGNVHPGFMGWVHGGGTPVGMLAELLAAGLNSNTGGRDHAAIEIEREVAGWMRDLFGFPESAGGLFVTGTSQANLLAVLAARTKALGRASRTDGVAGHGGKLRAYTSRSAHGCIPKAMEVSGLGSSALRMLATDGERRLDMDALAHAVQEDRAGGLTPFLVVASAGTVDTGAIDDLARVAAFCRREKLWFHVDGAFGALAMMSPALAPRLAGIGDADSIAFDFHKWGQVPYDAGFVLMRKRSEQLEAFAAPAAYLRRDTHGLGAGDIWPCDLGTDLSRGFRALKTWFTLKTYGTERLGQTIAHCCAVARHLEARVRAEPQLELLSPASLNIVCFRHRASDPDRFNAALAIAIQESGVAAPSTTILDGKLAIRACIVNHRTQTRDVDALVDVALAKARTLGA